MVGRRGHPVAPSDAQLRAMQRCTACDRAWCSAESPTCPFRRRARDAHPDASVGDNVPHIWQRDVHIAGDRVEISGRVYGRGQASGRANNCLIDILRQSLEFAGIDPDWVRQQLRVRFPGGEREVTASMFFEFGAHWRDILELLWEGAMAVGSAARANSSRPLPH